MSDHLISNSIYQAEETHSGVSVIFEVNCSGVDGLIANDADHVEGFLHKRIEPF